MLLANDHEHLYKQINITAKFVVKSAKALYKSMIKIP